jgi:hypothetical protein
MRGPSVFGQLQSGETVHVKTLRHTESTELFLVIISVKENFIILQGVQSTMKGLKIVLYFCIEESAA